MTSTHDSTCLITLSREALFEYMALARDVSFPDAQIRAICDTINEENTRGTIDLLRRLNPTPVAPRVQTLVQPLPTLKPVQRPSINSSEPGAILCADTFYKLSKDDCSKLQYLSTFCPFSLAFRKCVHGDACQLQQICWDAFCKRGKSCRHSHRVAPTCDAVFDAKRCPQTRRVVGDTKKCPGNHDYKVRLFMGAMRKPHELGFNGIRSTALIIKQVIQQDKSCDTPISDDMTSAGDEAQTPAEIEGPHESFPGTPLAKLNMPETMDLIHL